MQRMKQILLNWWNGDFYEPLEVSATNIGRDWPQPPEYSADMWFALVRPWYGLSSKRIILISVGKSQWFTQELIHQSQVPEFSPRKAVAAKYANRLDLYAGGVVNSLILKTKSDEQLMVEMREKFEEMYLQAQEEKFNKENNVITFPSLLRK